MKLLYYGPDGGAKSTVTGFWIIELKSLFSIVILKFNNGSRENYHSHAFNALTWFVKGSVDEYHKDGKVMTWKASFRPKFTPKTCFHKIFANEVAYAISFRGPWDKTWKEYSPTDKKDITLTHGRRIV